MRRILISIFGVFMIFSAFGVGENIPTSKSYVDAEIAIKQDKISANNGAAQVLTNTGTAGEYGTKGIYDSTGTYSTQSDGLIDAVTMNTAVQNAIDSEFQCVEYNPNDPTDCWLMDVRGETGKSILPSGYTALEYIESTGTQYIDTGIAKTSLVFKVEVDVSFADSTGRYLIGTSSSSPGYCGRATNGKFELNYSLRTTMSSGVNERVKMEYFCTGTQYGLTVTKNGTSESLIVDSSYSTGMNTSFAIYANHTESSFSRILNGKIYLAKIFINNELKRDLIPARRDSDGEIGMYDMVSGTFFTNAGSGDFIAGPVVNLYLPVGQ